MVANAHPIQWPICPSCHRREERYLTSSRESGMSTYCKRCESAKQKARLERRLAVQADGGGVSRKPEVFRNRPAEVPNCADCFMCRSRAYDWADERAIAPGWGLHDAPLE